MKLQRYEQTGVAMTCRSFEEYVRMFALGKDDLAAGAVLDVAGGASSFIAELNRLGYQGVAADPLYHESYPFLKQHSHDEIETSIAKLTALRDSFDWSYYGTPELHREKRLQSARTFLEDFQQNPSRYYGTSLPQLPFEDGAFSLVTCSHFLFLYADQFDTQFHSEAIKELVRVCSAGGKVLIYPLHSLAWERYPQLALLEEQLTDMGHLITYPSSQLRFIPGSFEMLCIQKNH